MVPETKFMHWMGLTSLTAKKPRMSKTKFKSMIVSFYIYGIVYLHQVPEGQTINQHYYLELLTHLHERIRKRTRFVEEHTSSFSIQDAYSQVQHLSVRLSVLLV